MKNERAKNAVVNSSVLATIQILTVLLRFVNQTVFIQTLGKQFLGLNGLFSNILSFLSFAELGVGTSIVYSIYKPLAAGDKREISALMNFIRRAYTLIGSLIGILGLVLIPFLPLFIKNYGAIDHIQWYFVLYLSNSVISYFFTYKRSILIADQHEYVSSINQFVYLIAQTVLQVIFLFVFKNYAFYLVIAVLCTLGSNLAISRAVDKSYPYLNENRDAKISADDRKEIGGNIAGMVGSKIGSIVVRSTDNILISAFLGLAIVGIYSNYLLIVTSISTVLNKLTTSVTAGIGNLIVTGNRERSMFVFKTHYMLNLFMVTLTAACLQVSFTPFIGAWAGKSYLLADSVSIVIVVQYFVDQLRQTSLTFISAYGLFIPNGVKSIFEAIMNLGLSLLLMAVFHLGIAGTLIGTLLTDLLLNAWWEPRLVYRDGFRLKKGFWQFFFSFIIVQTVFLFLLMQAAALLVHMVDGFIPFGGIVLAAFNSILVVVILSLVIALVYHKNSSFLYLVNIIKRVSGSLLRKAHLKK